MALKNSSGPTGADSHTDEHKLIQIGEKQAIVEVRYYHLTVRVNSKPAVDGVGRVHSIEFVYNNYTLLANGKYQITRGSFGAFGATNPGSLPNILQGTWVPPFEKGSMSLIGFAGLWARPNGDASTDQIRALKPLWIADSPVSSVLNITSVDHGNVAMSEIDAKIGTDDSFYFYNDGPTCIDFHRTIGESYALSNAATVSESVSLEVGSSITLGTSFEADGEVFGVGVKLTSDISFTAFATVGTEHTQATTWQHSEANSSTSEVVFHVPPFSIYTAKVSMAVAKVADSTWKGDLIVTCRNSKTRTFPVEGAFKGTDVSKIWTIISKSQPLPGYDNVGCGSSRIAGELPTIHTVVTSGLKEETKNILHSMARLLSLDSRKLWNMAGLFILYG